MKKLINTKGTEFEQNMQDLAIIDTEDRAGKPVMLSSEIFNESFGNADQDVQEMIEVEPSGPTNIYRVTSEEEMNALQNVEEGAFCIVINKNNTFNENTKDISSIGFKKEATISSAFDWENWPGFRLDPQNAFKDHLDGMTFDPYYDDAESKYVLQVYIYGNEILPDTGTYIGLIWSSTDGLNYSLTQMESQQGEMEVPSTDVIIPLHENPVRYDIEFGPWSEEFIKLGSFMNIEALNFSGLYEYKNNSWILTNLYMPVDSGLPLQET